MKSRSVVHLLPPLLVLGAGVVPAWADGITLRREVVLPATTDRVRLADVADLDGPAAAAWSDLMVAEVAEETVLTLTVGQIRAELETAGIHWGRVDLHGRDVRVRIGSVRAAEAPAAMQTARIGRVASSEARRRQTTIPASTDGDHPPTLRRSVLDFLAANLRVDPSLLKVTFDASDGPWLDEPLAGTRYEIRAMSDVSFTDRLDLEIRQWEHGRPGERRLIRVKPLIRCMLAEAAVNVPRLEPLRQHHVRTVEAWLTPSQRRIRLEPADVLGRIPVAPLRKGTLFRARDIRAVQIVDRGDQVIVRCLVGGAAISLKAQAESAGGLGETIELRRGRERDTFTAVVTGPGEAIIDLSPPVTRS